MDPNPYDADGHEPALDELVFRYLEEASESSAAPSKVLDALCAEHPAHAARLTAAVERLSGSGLTRAAEDAPSAPRIVGDYRLGERLGAGGMGVVFRATRTDGRGREVALKLLHPHERNEPGAQERFAREARAIERLDHPSIVRVVDHGEVAYGGIETPFIAMTYHAGATLDRFVASGRDRALRSPSETSGSHDGAGLGQLLHQSVAGDADPLERSSRFIGPWWRIVAAIGADLASALAHAHERGVVHRDVKPSNVLVAPDGRVLLLDFGLAWSRGSGRMTRSGTQLGSLPYLAPERIAGRPPGESVDVYALGLVLFELLTLRPAFDEEDPAALSVAVERGRSLRPSREAPWIPPSVAPSLDAIVERATQRDPRHRYRSMRAFAGDLAALQRGQPIEAEPLSSATRALRAARRQPWRVATFALVIAAAAGFALYERRVAADGRAKDLDELAAIEARLETLEGGFVKLAVSPLAEDPRFAPTALPGLKQEREDVIELRTRLQELGGLGLDVSRASLRADAILADLIIETANAQVAVGRVDASIPVYRERIECIERMIDEWTHEGEEVGRRLRSELGRSYGMLARALHARGPVETGLEPARRGVELIEAGYRPGMSDELTATQVVACQLILSEALFRSGQGAEASDALDRAETVSREAFGPAPRWLYLRGQRAEIEMNRYEFGLLEGGRGADIDALTRAIEWIDGSEDRIESNANVGAMRMFAGRALAVEQRRSGHFDDALATIERALAVGDELLTARSGVADSESIADDPLERGRRALEILAAVVRADLGGEDERAGALSILWAEHESARAQFDAANEDTLDDALYRYLAAAARYANDAAFRPDVEPWQARRAIEAMDAALEAAERRGATSPAKASPHVASAVRQCTYARGLAQVRAAEATAAYRAAQALEAWAESGEETDPIALRMAADLCNELRNRDADAPGAAAFERRTLELLEAAVDAGFDDLEELRSTEALDPLRSIPRFEALLGRVAALRESE
ncbi:MAG: serine/threonine-protein kinase [Planctomycetota bacterium]